MPSSGRPLKPAPAGSEERTYRIIGTPQQLNQFERLMSYLHICGAAGHTDTVKIAYDGDGDARMTFEAEDGRDLPLPLDYIDFYKTIVNGEREKITSGEYFRLLQKYRGCIGEDDGKDFVLEAHFKEGRPEFEIS